MEQFAINTVREPLKRDLQRFLERSVEQARLFQTEGQFRSLEMIRNETHALKGVGATLKAAGLTMWGEALEISVEWMLRNLERNRDLIDLCRLIEMSYPAWEALNELSVDEELYVAENYVHELLGWYLSYCDAELVDEITVSLGNSAAEDANRFRRSVLPRTHPKVNQAKLNLKKQEPTPKPRPGSSLPGLITKPKENGTTNDSTKPLIVEADSVDIEELLEESEPHDESWKDAFLEFFMQDGEEQARQIEQAALAWEAGEPVEDQIEKVSRCLHTLKGAANSVNLNEMGLSLHETEEFLEKHPNPKALSSFFLKVADHLRQYFRKLRDKMVPWTNPWHEAMTLELQNALATGGERVVAQPQEEELLPEDDSPEQMIRISGATINRLSTRVAELLIDRNRLETKLSEMTRLQQNLVRTNRELISRLNSFGSEFEFTMVKDKSQKARRGNLKTNGKATSPSAPPLPSKKGDKNGNGDAFSDIEFDQYDRFNILARSLSESAEESNDGMQQLAAKFDSFEEDMQTFRITAKNLQEDLVSLSVLPFSSVSERLNRALRDAALLYPNKKVRFNVIGENTLIDKDIVDRLFTPLMHLVRNSVAHGIENQEIREKKQKSLEGLVEIRLEAEGDEIVVEVFDDGGGINVDAIRAKAIEKGMLSPNSPPLSLDQAVELIFQPRFSTAEEVNSVSGRGIGMDVVRTEIRGMNGSISFLPTEIGTHWIMKLPLRMNLGEAILAVVEGQTLAFPLGSIKQALIVAPREIHMEDHHRFYSIEDNIVPLIDMGTIFGKPPQPSRERAFWIGNRQQQAVVMVDRVLARQEIVLNPLPPILQGHPLLSGTTLDGYGRIVPVLDPDSLLEYQETEAVEEVETVSEDEGGIVRVLVVDDSISVRKVQETLLSELGCEVVSANNGADALDKLRTFTPQMILTDLEMPLMDGYELIQEIKANAQLRNIPIVVVSSRSADKYITKAMQFGAASFLSKPFGKEQIQQIIEQFGKKR